jgi:membrane protease YdiL (CAAX protease family)
MQLFQTITATDFIWLAGLLLLACWLLDTSLGRKALADSLPRRNSMPFYMPLVPLLLWFGGVAMAVVLVQKLTPGLQGWQEIFRDHIVMSIGAVLTIAVMMFLADAHFSRRLKGFGLNIRTIVRDFFMAIVNMLAAWPLILAAITVTIFFVELLSGRQYQMQPHQQLEMVAEYPQLPLRIMIVFVAVVIAPLLEEMMFRGFVQTTIRSILDLRFSPWRGHLALVPYRWQACPERSRRDANGTQGRDGLATIGNRQSTTAWPAIMASSVFFAIMHADPAHWPALFVLGVCLGYSYEKSGSLFRPIFIHLLFNASSVAIALYQAGAQ